jgi:hypothetical protein
MLEHERVFLEDILHSSFVFSASENIAQNCFGL